ncbi:hypothetical protein KIW84_051535 [Lathyrus oleraceus]|uniref:Uncharacterized protein n=1 Tax=Pisum sativum TaxID=3888 RepID=A0A9D5AE09_PEA|nr:hypothetical protein KIW84_051535 [Pisum sativum]
MEKESLNSICQENNADEFICADRGIDHDGEMPKDCGFFSIEAKDGCEYLGNPGSEKLQLKLVTLGLAYRIIPNINSRHVTRQDELCRPKPTVIYSGLPGFHRPDADTAQERYNSTCHGSRLLAVPYALVVEKEN